MVLITDGTDLSSVEVLHPSGVPFPCTLPPLPASRKYLTQDGLVACGGMGTATSTSCVSLTGGGWQESHQLQQERYDHSSWRSPAGLLLMGGFDSPTSTELLSVTDSSTSSNFTLEYRTV